MPDLTELGIAEAARLIAAKKISPVELTARAARLGREFRRQAAATEQ